jgi:hypothetical protein
MTSHGTTIPRRFVELSLALEQHIPGYVDSYFGPPEWKEASVARGPQPIDDLARQAETLAADIAQEGDLDDQRRDYLARHVTAMQTSLRLLHGEVLPLAEETALLYDVTPQWVDEHEFEEAHRQLDALLPPGESLFERLVRRKEAIEITWAQAEPLLPVITAQLRQLTRERFPLPAGEAFELFPVNGQPWLAYNWYLGQGRSRIDINTDLPLQITSLAETLAHEGYPGHHTELSIKEARLFRAQGQLESCLSFMNMPSCLVAEGIAVRALDVLLPPDEQIRWHAEEIFPRAGRAHLNAEREHQIDRAMRRLAGVWDNAAFLLHDQHQGKDEVSAYFRQYSLRREKEVDKAVEFISTPLSRSYVFNYRLGGVLLDELFAAKGNAPYWFTRLLTEPVTPGQIRAWLAN